MTTMVKRTTLIVRDVERSRAFYRDVLGMRTWYDDRITLSGVGLAAGKKGDETHLVIMEASDPVVAKIGVLQFTSPALPPPPGLACTPRRTATRCAVPTARRSS
jgi:catechol 2,3-dioxygenase-like lactoylglutathione lyase family enzyme